MPRNLTSEQIKLACFWEQAVYKKNEKENQKYIEELKKDESSDIKEPVGTHIMASTIETSTVLGPLGPRESESWEVILTSQRRYNIFVHAHEPNVDFDLYVFDENENLIDVDDDLDSNAYCSIAPNWTAPFQIVIECVRGISTFQLSIEEE